ncbi:MAG TPA: low affinity iron permease family protein [Gemmatirosa sp.]
MHELHNGRDDRNGHQVGEAHELFRRFAQRTSTATGSAGAFTLAVLTIVVWGVTGPLFHFSDAWQLVINTGTTIITFLMVFLIQATQNRDTRAVHLKLDELLRAVDAARTSMMELENESDSELDRIRAEFGELRQHAEREMQRVASGEAERREAGRRVGDRVR